MGLLDGTGNVKNQGYVYVNTSGQTPLKKSSDNTVPVGHLPTQTEVPTVDMMETYLKRKGNEFSNTLGLNIQNPDVAEAQQLTLLVTANGVDKTLLKRYIANANAHYPGIEQGVNDVAGRLEKVATANNATEFFARELFKLKKAFNIT